MFGKNKEQKPDLEVFAIYDTKVGVYKDPVFAINRYEMIRSIERFFRSESNQLDPFFTNPEDFQLFKIAEYTREKGLLQGQNPEHIVNLHEIHSALMASIKAQKPPGALSAT